MKALLQHNKLYNNVACTYNKQKKIKDTWHYHPELEIIYIKKGNGSSLIGDSISNFSTGDVFIIGSNLPHSFKNKIKNYDFESITLFLNSNFLKRLSQFETEFYFLKEILKLSKLGIKYRIKNDQNLLNQLIKLSKVQQNVCSLYTLAFIKELYFIKNYETLGTSNSYKTEELRDERLEQIIEFTTSNFENDIDLNSIASIVGMNKSAFCRFFKQKTGKTYFTYLNEVRVNKACQILKLEHNNITITSACFKSGFNNLSYFNRIFKKYMGLTPSQYLCE